MNKIHAFIFLFVAFINYTFGQTKVEKLDELVSLYAAYDQFNGSVLVAANGEIIYKKGFGLANVEWDIPNQSDTRHRLASITKQFTAMLIVQLAAENKLRLDAPISTYLPDYPKQTGDIVTIHHLLTHSSGIPSYTSMPSYRDMMHDPYTPDEIVRLFADSALEFTPGEKFQYSNSGYVLLGYIIEKITGSSYEEALQLKIFTPLHMTNSGYDHTSATIKNRASGYDRFGTTIRNAYYIDMSVPFAAGGIYSTIEDLYLWDQALYTEKIIPAAYRDLLFKPHMPVGKGYYGYGWEIGKIQVGNTDEKAATIGHSGGINGFNTLITRMPSDRALIVLLNNMSGAPLEEMTVAITGILHNASYDFPKKSLANTLYAIIEEDGIEAGLSQYLKVKDSADYYLHEAEMNSVGYQFLQSGRAREAAAVFKLNVEAFPKSYNTYDSYGEALLVLGDTAQSIENYSKSVKLNPGNEFGLKVLKSLGVNPDTLIVKMAIEDLKLLEGEYLITNPPSDEEKTWKIDFTEAMGVLTGNDRGYQYKLVPVGVNQFINPDDGASLVFDTRDTKAITMTLFGRFKFRKVS